MQFFYFLNNFLFKPNYIFSIISIITLAILFYIGFIYFFETTQNKEYLKLKKYLFIVLNIGIFALSTIFVKSIFSQAIIIFFTTMSLTILLKESFVKNLLYATVFTIILFNLEALALKPLAYFLNYTYTDLIQIPLFNITISLCMFISFILSYFIIHKLKINSIEIIENLKNSIEIFVIYFIDLFLAFEFLHILFNFVTNYNYILLLFFFILNFYYLVSISDIFKTFTLNNNHQKISNLELYNKSISAAYDETRTFKHDSNNIFQALSGYITNDDFEGLKEYFWQVFPAIKNINNLSKLSPTLVNNPAIYGLLVEKHFKAEKYNVNIHLDIMLDLNTIHMKIFELTRILGILVDNAIETAKDCAEKKVNVCFKRQNNRQILIVENTYSNKEICIDKIFEKGYSTKPNNTGLGLWEVRKILNKNTNLNLYTSKTNDYFMQQLEIY